MDQENLVEVSIEFDDDLLEKLELYASQEGVSTHDFIVRLLTEHYEQTMKEEV